MKTKTIGGIEWHQYNDGAWRAHEPARWLDHHGPDWSCARSVRMGENFGWLRYRGKTAGAAVRKLLAAERRLIKELGGKP